MRERTNLPTHWFDDPAHRLPRFIDHCINICQPADIATLAIRLTMSGQIDADHGNLQLRESLGSLLVSRQIIS